ncbi:magnesium chelatase [Pseudomonas sp. Pseusp97]|uniref:magnesium chelatase n=1 Tax=Pseudomonas sp. Pseusp97 TaxID=3243065 RepID=UPI0039A500B9
MGRTARAKRRHGRTPATDGLAKKALSIRPRPAPGADANPRPGQLAGAQLLEPLLQLTRSLLPLPQPARICAGGGTPLVEALEQAREWLDRRQRQKPGEHRRLLVLTDGRLRDWPTLQPLNCPTVLVDIEGGAVRLGRARKLAEELGADYRQIGEVSGETH